MVVEQPGEEMPRMLAPSVELFIPRRVSSRKLPYFWRTGFWYIRGRSIVRSWGVFHLFLEQVICLVPKQAVVRRIATQIVVFQQLSGNASCESAPDGEKRVHHKCCATPTLLLR